MQKEEKDAFGERETATKAISTFVSKLISEKHYIAINLSALLVNSRHLARTEKRDITICVLRSNNRMALHLKELVENIAPKKFSNLALAYLSLYWQFVMNDFMIGDNFLIQIFRDIADKFSNEHDKLLASDLLVACCEEEPSILVNYVAKSKRVEEIVAIYIRLIMMYYFRCHRSLDKARIKTALKDLRKLAKGFNLPQIA